MIRSSDKRLRIAGATRHVAIGFAAMIGVAGASLSPAFGADGEFVYRCEGIETASNLSSLGTQLYQGTEGWFFRKSELENLFEIPAASQRAFTRINDALAYKGIHLVVLPMLPRGIAGQNFIPNNGLLADMVYDAQFSADQFSSFIDSVEQLGIQVVDINELRERNQDFDWDGYTFKQDIHWKPEGARLVAGLVAEKIRALLPENTKPVQFETSRSETPVPIDGGFTQALNEVCQEKIPVEEFHTYQTKRVLNSLDALFEDEGTAEAGQAVHIAGTSFTDEKKKYNFAGFLREYLERDISNFAVAGGGLTESIYGWAQNPSGLGAKPKVLLWEYSNHRDVLEKANYLNDAVVPAIFGACSGELVTAESGFSRRTGLELTLQSLTGRADDYYLRFQFSNPALTEFRFTFKYADGREVIANFSNPERVTGLTELYRALPDDTQELPRTVDVRFGGDMQADGNVQVCRYPPNVFSSRTISN